MEGRIKLEIGRKEAHDTGNPWPHLEAERSKVKVTRLLNVVTENQPHLRNGKAYELQTWYTDGVRWPASPTCAVTSNLKAVGGCSCHQSQGEGAYCVGSTKGGTACYIRHNQSPHQICESCDFSFFSWLHFDDHRYLLVSLDLQDGDQKPHAVYIPWSFYLAPDPI